VVLRYVTFNDVIVLSRSYVLVCKGCQGETRVSRAEAEVGMTRNPVPFFHRWGGVVLIAVAGILAIFGLLITTVGQAF
jgi:hypothetical protein